MISMQLPSPSLPQFPTIVRALLAATAVLVAACPVAAQPTVEYALGLAPFQKNVDYDKLTADQAKGATLKMEKEGGLNAWVVRGPRGEVLRSFADTNGDRVVDRWSYYKDGLEVYRDIDAEVRFAVGDIVAAESPLCRSGEVLKGTLKPNQCPAFGKECTPRTPLGATMVSSEGACAAHYHFGR